MKFTNSPLITYTKISPNSSNPRNHGIDTITIHCMAGDCSVETCGKLFSQPSCQASSNYGIDSDGRIALYVEEKNRSWCTSSSSNDNRAVTIEVANNGGAEAGWPVSDKAYNALIELIVDVCQRNEIRELKWCGDKSLVGQIDKQNMTVHRWFANKDCPGDYLYNLHGDIATQVNKRLAPIKDEFDCDFDIKVGDFVSIKEESLYYNDRKIPAWITEKEWIVLSVDGARVVIDKSTDGENSICSPIHAKYLTVTFRPVAFNPYRVKVNANALNIRSGAGTEYGSVGKITDRGIYTIVAESEGKGSSKGWGKLSSGAGWISLEYCIKQ